MDPQLLNYRTLPQRADSRRFPNLDVPDLTCWLPPPGQSLNEQQTWRRVSIRLNGERGE